MRRLGARGRHGRLPATGLKHLLLLNEGSLLLLNAVVLLLRCLLRLKCARHRNTCVRQPLALVHDGLLKLLKLEARLVEHLPHVVLAAGGGLAGRLDAVHSYLHVPHARRAAIAAPIPAAFCRCEWKECTHPGLVRRLRSVLCLGLGGIELSGGSIRLSSCFILGGKGSYCHYIHLCCRRGCFNGRLSR